jgi:hypothetical protein
MKRTFWLWVLALVLTLGSAVWQRMTGPTHPVRGTVVVGGEQVRMKLTRTHGGPGDQPITVAVQNNGTEGAIAWRRYPTTAEWSVLPLLRQGDVLQAALPHQPPAGKLEYQVRLRHGAEVAVFPERPAVTRFKGDVPASVLIPHIIFIFGAMLLSTRAGLAALTRNERLSRLTLLTVAFLIVGGFVLGPIIQKLAFGAYWTGFPFGNDLTDNKVLVAGLAWGVALWRVQGAREDRRAVLVAALITLAIFIVPHSTMGSELKWDELASTSPASR